MADKELAQLQVLEMKARGVLTLMVGNLKKELKRINNLNFQSKKNSIMANIGIYLDYLDILERSLKPASPVARIIGAQVKASDLVTLDNVEAEKRRWNAVIIQIRSLKATDIDSFLLEMNDLLGNVEQEIRFLQDTLRNAIAARMAA